MYKELHEGDEVTCQYGHPGEMDYRPNFKVKILKTADTFMGRVFLCEDENMHFVCKAYQKNNESESDLVCINGYLYDPKNETRGSKKTDVLHLLGF